MADAVVLAAAGIASDKPSSIAAAEIRETLPLAVTAHAPAVRFSCWDCLFEAAHWKHQIECQQQPVACAHFAGRAAPNRGRYGFRGDMSASSCLFNATMMM